MRMYKLGQVEVFIWSYHQILVTKLQGNVLQLERRINNQILGVKGLIHSLKHAQWFEYYNYCNLTFLDLYAFH